MEKFTKYYSYNQFIENFDVLVMTDQQYLANKDKLDNPQRIVLVNRAGGPKEPKAPKWFTTYMESFEKKMINMMDQKLKSFAKLNNLKYEEEN